MTLANALNPRILQPGDIDPNWRWDRHLPALGHTAVDLSVVWIMTVFAAIA